MEYEGLVIESKGHACVKIKGEKVIYIDPFQLKEEEKADLILITHGHYDHCSIEDIKKISTAQTTIIITPDCQSKLPPERVKAGEVKMIRPRMELTVKGTRIEAVPAYNLKKDFHQKEEEWVGYIVNIEGKRMYHAGDTDLIPEMHSLKNIDVAFLPVGGTYTMDAKEAANAANIIQPKIAVPIHYGKIVGKREDEEIFKRLCQVKVEIL